MTELERRALLGDRQAQEEITKQGIVLPCPFCGDENVALVDAPELWYRCEKCGSYGPEGNGSKSALAKWNHRPAPPIGRCKDCTHKEKATVNAKGFLICPASGMEIAEDDYCSYFEPKEKEI